MAPPRKRVKTQAVEEVTFDDSARAEYLTGFHKRKQERIKHSQQLAAKREREERVAQRKEIRQQRKEDMERHVAEVNALLRKANASPSGSGDEDDDDDEADEWAGIEDAPEPVDREDEYIDEDKYTTVTVETVDIGRDGFSRPSEIEEGEGSEADNNGGKDGEKVDAVAKTGGGRKRQWTKEKPRGEAKKKKPKFRYESKAERRVTKSKQREKNSKQAKARRGN